MISRQTQRRVNTSLIQRNPSPAIASRAAFGARVPSVMEGASLAAFIAEVDAAGRVKSEDKRGVVAPSTPRPLAELDLALRESARGTGDARLSNLVRGPLAAIESAMARKARETGRRFDVAVAALVPGAARRVAAERAPPDTGESPQTAHC